MKHLPEVTKCCCWDLKNGTIIIGVLQSVFAFMCTILSAAYAVHPKELIDMTDPSIVPDLNHLKVLLIIIAVTSALQSIFSITLIFGAVLNNPVLLTPWLILNPICLFVYMVVTMSAIVYHTADNNTPFVVGHILFSMIVTLMVTYMTLTVHSFKNYLKRLNF